MLQALFRWLLRTLAQATAGQPEASGGRRPPRAPGAMADRGSFGLALFGTRQAWKETDAARLRRAGLPVVQSEQELALWLGVDLGRLRWFTYDNPADSTWHYTRFTIPKRSGGERVILAPKRELKALQRKVLRDLVGLVPAGDSAHGFVVGRSIASNARVHVGRTVVANLDLQDFFPSITFPRVRGLFISWGYGFAVASTLALLCTEYAREERHDGTRTVYKAVGPRHLVQGAPTSPALANLVARHLDRRLAGLATKHGFAYTRYADDLTFSGAERETALRVITAAGRIITTEGFALNPAKTRLYPNTTRQVVTGLVVNSAVGVPRRERRRLRAILHQAGKAGLESQNRDGRKNFRSYLAGLIGHVNAASRAHGAPLRAALQALGRAGAAD